MRMAASARGSTPKIAPSQRAVEVAARVRGAMKAILFGASGMVGQGVLRECLASDAVESALLVGGSASGVPHSKVHEIGRADLYDYAGVGDQLAGYDACFFCLG